MRSSGQETGAYSQKETTEERFKNDWNKHWKLITATLSLLVLLSSFSIHSIGPESNCLDPHQNPFHRTHRPCLPTTILTNITLSSRVSFYLSDLHHTSTQQSSSSILLLPAYPLWSRESTAVELSPTSQSLIWTYPHIQTFFNLQTLCDHALPELLFYSCSFYIYLINPLTYVVLLVSCYFAGLWLLLYLWDVHKKVPIIKIHYYLWLLFIKLS